MSDNKVPRLGVDNTNREKLDVRGRLTFDMSENAAKAMIADATSKAKVATSTHATPARQESVRVGLVVAGIAVWGVVARLCGFSDDVIKIGILGVGGIYGLGIVPKAIEKARSPKPDQKSLTPAPPTD